MIKIELTTILDAIELMNSPMTSGMAQNQVAEMRQFAVSELASGERVVLVCQDQYIRDLKTEDAIITLFNTDNAEGLQSASFVA
ncbi:hypothetical protein [uncultured Thalassospira sp.]|uniref:hypothetical protein n=1 Tax=uncultured Thalassospira sp. TaxID=404382 RepID=UPI00258E1D07|nr:hypothetical protein [uncultured Thalassospira sp.]